jgi:hypothetical protein
MGESITTTKEKVELVNINLSLSVGNSIEKRRQCMKSFVGVGAPDFCVETDFNYLTTAGSLEEL